LTLVELTVLDRQHRKANSKQVAELRQNHILLRSIRCFRSRRPYSDCIFLTVDVLMLHNPSTA